MEHKHFPLGVGNPEKQSLFMEGGKILGLHSQQMLNTWSLAASTGIVGILFCQNLPT